MQATVVFVVGLGETAAALRRLAGDVEETVKRLAEPGATAPIVPPVTSLRNEVAVPPRDAFLGEAEQVGVDNSVGRISCESIASYPPGVPALLPGERISGETVAYLRELAESGARLHGADRKSTRLNSSHANISYAVFCLKKKKTNIYVHRTS